MDNNYTKDWVIKRKKGNKLILCRIPLSEKFAESYSMFRITFTESRMLLSVGSWEQVDEDEFWSCKQLSQDTELKNKFFEIAKLHITNDVRQEVSKKVESNVPGTSCLIRTSNKSYIQIGFRKGRNITQINRVCISDRKREEFFETCRRTDDPQATTYYKIRNGYKYFDEWSTFMDEEYKRQINR